MANEAIRRGGDAQLGCMSTERPLSIWLWLVISLLLLREA
jgi:hypothetical protein